jgi:hypothetical protein
MLLESVALSIGSTVSGKVSSNKLAKGRSPDGHLAGRLIAKTERKREKRVRNEIYINKQKKDERRKTSRKKGTESVKEIGQMTEYSNLQRILTDSKTNSRKNKRKKQ